MRFIFIIVSTYFLGLGGMSQNTLPIFEETRKKETPQTVEVEGVTKDEKIAHRLTRIFNATGWFKDISVSVDEGITFLKGIADTSEHKDWAFELAQKTQGVVAVVNRITIAPQAWLDTSLIKIELKSFTRAIIKSLPLLFFALLLLLIAWFLAKAVMRGFTRLLKPKVKSFVLRSLIARIAALLVFIVALYLILRISGLSRLALTVVGSTGVIGLVLGFAFRDIAENFLASVLLSIQQPFKKRDLIYVSGIEGYVQSVNTRCTLLMTRDGNHVQIPNAIIYKEVITNYTSNPNTRYDFIIGIGYDDIISEAQSLALKVLEKHPAVVNDPEPLILVDELKATTINLRIIFWIDTTAYSHFKVQSAIMRQVKVAFQDADISMPGEVREITFPEGMPITIPEEERTYPKKVKRISSAKESHFAEGALTTEAVEIEEQAHQARSPEGGTDLLEDD